MDKNVIKIIENHKMENDILQEKDVSRWYMKLRQKININFFLHPSFMLSMNKKQFLQFAQFQVHHFFEKEKDNNTYVTGYDDPLFSNMIFDSFIKLVTTNQKLLNKLQKQLIYAAQCDPLSFFFLSRKRDFCSIYCKDVTKYKACGVKGWLRIFFPEAKIQAFFHSLLEIYDFLQEIEFKIHDCDIAPLKHMVKNVRIIEKTPLDTKYKARFYQLCCDWLCENQTMQHKDFIRSLNKVWRVAKNSFNKADQMTRDGEVLKIQNCAKDTYYRSMFDLQQFDQERPTHQTRQERLRAIQKYNLDPVCSIDEAATYIHGFSNKPDMFGLLEN